MLQTIRSKTHGTVAWVVIILIGFVFAVWGIEGYVNSDSNQVARVNGEIITTQAYQRTYQQVMRQQQMMQMTQGGQPINEGLIREQALAGLVNEKMLATVAHKQGFAVGDEQVDNLLRMLPQFQENGVYAPEKLEAVINSMGYTPIEFRQAVKNDLMIGQVRSSIVDSAFVLPYELDKAISLLEQTRDISYLIIPASEYLAQINVNDADVQAYYDAHPADFMLPERASIEYVRLDASKYTIDTPDEATLQAYYETNKAQYTEPEKRHAVHILLTADKAGGEVEMNALADKLMQELQQGADFATLAKEYSADPGSAANGGDLGWFGRGAMVPEFDEAVFTAQSGDLVGPVKTNFGLHIIKVVEVQPEQVKPFADVKDQVQAAWMNEQRDSRFAADAAQLDTLAFENPETLAPAAEGLNLPVEKTDFITRDNTAGLGELNTPEVVQALFGDTVLLEDRNSDLIYVTPTDVVVLRKLAYEAPQQEDFAMVKDKIKQQLATEQAAKQAHENANAWLAALREGKTVDQLDHGQLTWVNQQGTNRYNMAVPPEVLDAAFTLPVHHEKTGVTADILPLGENDYAIVMVNGVHDGKLDPNFAEEMRTEYVQGLTTFKGELDYQLYAAQARKDSDIDLNEQF